MRSVGSTPYLFVAPFFVVFAAFGIYPLIYALQLSFMRWRGAGAATGSAQTTTSTC